MSSVVQKLNKKGLIYPPKWLPDNTAYEVVTGSVAYGVSGDMSDADIVGFCIPPKYNLFPHLAGEILGFGKQADRFNQYQKHHIKDEDKEYDITVYSIVKFFNLCMENNPNMVDVLFVPERCILHITEVGQHIRNNKHLFLHKGSYHKFRGYAYSQLTKLDNGSNKSNPKRQESVEKYGYDVKFAYHIVRLALECEQILYDGYLELDINSEILKSIRRGEWELTHLKDWFDLKSKSLETLYNKSTLRKYPDENKIKQILIECLEMHYGSIDNAIAKDKNVEMLVDDIENVLEKYREKS